MTWTLECPDKNGQLFVDTRGSLEDCLAEMFYLYHHPPAYGEFKLVLTYESGPR